MPDVAVALIDMPEMPDIRTVLSRCHSNEPLRLNSGFL